MPTDPRLMAQINLILDGHHDARAFPPDWDTVGYVRYLYRKETILFRERDYNRVTAALREVLPQDGEGERPPFDTQSGPGNILVLTLPDGSPSVPDVLEQLDARLPRGMATAEYLLYVCGYPCPATEPEEVPPGAAPFPAPGSNAHRCRPCHGIPRPECDGDDVFISIVDTGLIDEADKGHPWLTGVDGTPEDPYTVDANGNTIIVPYAGHGTFAAGVARCMAPKAGIYVERAFNIAAADYETNLTFSLEDALDRNPDIFVFTFTTSTRNDQPLITFDDFYERRIRYLKGMVVLAPAGNDGQGNQMWPAGYPGVISVGALSANWRNRAHFSNYGEWVDVYAPGEDLVNAFPAGTYVCKEPPIGQQRQFAGMAKWSGTSFSTPLVAGLIAARMSATGENARQAADSLLRLACSQAIPGVGAVLYPGQACCEADCCRH